MKVWILGAGGMLGQMLSRVLRANAHEVLDERVDITDSKALQHFAEHHRPAALVNCAAYTQVDQSESDQERAYLINARGVESVGEVAARYSIKAVHISTDYVFDGENQVPYRETDVCHPINVYGASKWAGERAFAAALAGRPHFIVRTSWLYGPGGRNFVATMLQLMQTREELRVVCDQQGRPTYTWDLAMALNALLQSTAASGVYHVTGGGSPTTWQQFATEILRQASQAGMHLKCRTLLAIPSKDYPTPAKRPAYSVLDMHKFSSATGFILRPWELALADYFK